MTFLITAGPTREPIDPVRFISNRSSGRMGYAPADEMADSVQTRMDTGCDVFIASAAVADFKPRDVSPRKIKKSEGIPHIELVPTRDILASVALPRDRRV